MKYYYTRVLSLLDTLSLPTLVLKVAIHLRIVYLLLICLFSNHILAQPNQSKIENKGNHNIIKVIQAGTLVIYDLSIENESQKLLSYLRSIPNISKLLNQQGHDLTEIKNQNKLLIDLVRNNKEGFMSLDDYNKGLEHFIIENNLLKNQIIQLKVQYQNPELLAILNQAEERLKQFDNQGYQQILENFKKHRIAKLKQEKEELAFVSYLQSLNSSNLFLYQQALERVNEALGYDSTKPLYQIQKGRVLSFLYHIPEAINLFQRIDLTSVNDTLKALIYSSLGFGLEVIGKYDQAIIYDHKALTIQIRTLGKEHPDLATTYNNLGTAFIDKGQYDSSIAYNSKALAIRLKVYGLRHSDVAMSYVNLGGAYQLKGEIDIAIKLYNQASDVYITTLGKMHPIVANSYSNLGSVYSSKKDYKNAINYFNKALCILLPVMGKNHPYVAAVYNNIGATYNNKGEPDSAIAYSSRALIIQDSIFGKEHPDVALTYNNLGAAYETKREHKKAIEYYSQALPIFLKLLKVDHPNTQKCLKDISFAFVADNQIDKGVYYFEQVNEYHRLPSKKKAALFNTTGVENFQKKNYQIAINLYSIAESFMTKAQLPKTDELWAVIYQNIAKTHCYMGHKVQAKKYFDAAIKYAKLITDTEVTKTITQNFEECKKR